MRNYVAKYGENRADNTGQDDAATGKIVSAKQDWKDVKRRYRELERRQRVYQKNACSKCGGKDDRVWACGMKHDCIVTRFQDPPSVASDMGYPDRRSQHPPISEACKCIVGIIPMPLTITHSSIELLGYRGSIEVPDIILDKDRGADEFSPQIRGSRLGRLNRGQTDAFTGKSDRNFGDPP
jgi:hypothetical protein